MFSFFARSALQFSSHSSSVKNEEVLTYGSCIHPLLWDSQRLHRSALWTGGSYDLNTENNQEDKGPEEEEFRVQQWDNALHQTYLHSRAPCHTTSSLGYTGRSMHTETGSHHKSVAEESQVLRWKITVVRCMQKG